MATEPVVLTTPLWSEIVVSDDEFEGESEATRRALLRQYITAPSAPAAESASSIVRDSAASTRPPRPSRDHRRRRPRNNHRGHKFAVDRSSNAPSNHQVSSPPPRPQHVRRFAGITIEQLIAWPRQPKSTTSPKSEEDNSSRQIIDQSSLKQLASAPSAEETSTTLPHTDESFFNSMSSCNEFDSTEDTTPSRKSDFGAHENSIEEEEEQSNHQECTQILSDVTSATDTITVPHCASKTTTTPCTQQTDLDFLHHQDLTSHKTSDKTSYKTSDQTSEHSSDHSSDHISVHDSEQERTADIKLPSVASAEPEQEREPIDVEIIGGVGVESDKVSLTDEESAAKVNPLLRSATQRLTPSSTDDERPWAEDGFESSKPTTNDEAGTSDGVEVKADSHPESDGSLDNDNVDDVVFSQSYDIWYTDAIAGPKKGIDQKMYEGGMHYMGTFTSAAQYFEAHNMLPWTSLPPNSVVAVCRHGIRPIWEDAANAKGGRFVVKNFPKEETEALFAKTALGFFSAMLRDGTSYNLVSVHIRDGRRGSDIQIWRNSTLNRLSPQEVKKDIAPFTSPDVANYLTVSFVPNRDSLVRNDCKLASAASTHSHKSRSGGNQHSALRRSDTIESTFGTISYSAASKSVSRMYSKGKSSFTLSPEQKEAIAKAAVRDAADFAAKAPSALDSATSDEGCLAASQPELYDAEVLKIASTPGNGVRSCPQSGRSSYICEPLEQDRGLALYGPEASSKVSAEGSRSRTPSVTSDAANTQSPYSIRSRSSSQRTKYSRRPHPRQEVVDNKCGSNDYRRHANHQRGDYSSIPTVRFSTHRRCVSPIPDMVHPAEMYAAGPLYYYSPPNAYPPAPYTSVSCRGVALHGSHLNGLEKDTDNVAMGVPSYAYSTPTMENFVDAPYWQLGAAPPVNCVVDPLRGGYGYAASYWSPAPAAFAATPFHLIQSSETKN